MCERRGKYKCKKNVKILLGQKDFLEFGMNDTKTNNK